MAQPARPRLDVAERKLRAAVSLDAQGRYQEALANFEQSLGEFLALTRIEPDERRKKAYRDIVEAYIPRAEQLKLHITENEAPSKARTGLRGTKTDVVQRKASVGPPSSSADNKRARAAEKPLLAAEEKKKGVDVYEETILNEMLDHSPGIRWDDIAGLQFAKDTLQEAVILPNLRPDLFVGLRAPPRGVLLFGPPGTGKTMLAKAVATESGFSFFNITASVVTSKWVGEGEKLMKAVFSAARKRQPSVVFFDEIDALLSSRREGENEASRRLKTEFMVQVDGVNSDAEDRILVMGATNIPQALDEAVLRRMVKRIYIPLPDAPAREALVRHLLNKMRNTISDRDMKAIVKSSDGYSCSDLTALCKDAAMGPIRELGLDGVRHAKADEVRPINKRDFEAALRRIRPSVSTNSLQAYTRWNAEYGST